MTEVESKEVEARTKMWNHLTQTIDNLNIMFIKLNVLADIAIEQATMLAAATNKGRK